MYLYLKVEKTRASPQNHLSCSACCPMPIAKPGEINYLDSHGHMYIHSLCWGETSFPISGLMEKHTHTQNKIVLKELILPARNHRR